MQGSGASLASSRRHAAALAALVAAALPIGCGQPLFADKHSAEENGYLSYFRFPLKSACEVGTTRQEQVGVVPTQVQCGMTPMGTPMMCMQPMPILRSVKVDSLADSGVKLAEVRNELQRTLPPPDLARTHGLLARAVELEMKGVGRGSSEAAKAACAGFTGFEEAVRARTEVLPTTDSLYITYKPPILPPVTLDSRDGLSFGLGYSVTIPTKVGSFTAGYKGGQGIRILRVVSEGKQRILTLDRPFESLIPEGYVTRVAFQGKDELVLYVDRA